MEEKLAMVKVQKEYKTKSQKYIGPSKTHRNFSHFTNRALDHYLNFVKKEEEKKSE